MPGGVENSQGALDPILRVKLVGPGILALLSFVDVLPLQTPTRNITYEICDQGKSLRSCGV